MTKYNALPGTNLLTSGIIVLVDEDYDDYINGELIFYDKEEEKE